MTYDVTHYVVIKEALHLEDNHARSAHDYLDDDYCPIDVDVSPIGVLPDHDTAVKYANAAFLETIADNPEECRVLIENKEHGGGVIMLDDQRVRITIDVHKV